MAPISDQDFIEIVQGYIKSNSIMIFSKSTCPFCVKVKDLFKSLGCEYFSIELDQISDGNSIQRAMGTICRKNTVPQVFINGNHVGGCDDTMAAYKSEQLQKLIGTSSQENYDYDLIVIGGGSGGLAASKEAARFGKKVAVLDFVTPTPHGATWGLGGTCVNVGCIPKKLMHQAAMLKMAIKDSESFGWRMSGEVIHAWTTMRDAIQNHISSLNWNYRVQLKSANVQYLNAYGTFVEQHKLKIVDKKKRESFITAKYFIIATGERPKYPDIEGAKEYGITSDDLFSLKECPGKTLVVGASYVALECAGFLAGIGLDVTVMVRSILLRGFDQDMAEKIGEFMKLYGVKFIRPCVPKKIEKVVVDGISKLKVLGEMCEENRNVEDIYDTVLFAIGRESCTKGIGLEDVGVFVNPRSGKIPTVNEQTNVSHIYAVGDVLYKKPELTPVAIQAGILLAQRLYGNSEVQCDYVNVPTTVFTPLEYGCVGLSEDSAIEQHGASDIEVYHTNFTPLEWTVAKRHENMCYVKVVCLKSKNEQIVGFHYLGPNAGEVIQGFALGLKKGVTKADLDSIIGIHPTCAEEFTTLRITKSSGESASKEGC